MMTVSKTLMRMKKNFKKTKWILTMNLMVKVVLHDIPVISDIDDISP